MARIRWLPVYVGAAVIAAMPAWGQCTVTDTTSFNQAITGTCATITLNNNILLTGNLSPITRNLTIEGGGFTVDGASQFHALQVDSGTVSMNSLTINNAVAQGSSSGAGLGGGLFVGGTATVTTSNVLLTNNQAVGGNSGPGSADGGSGLGGGIFVQSGGTLTINGSLTLTGNMATGGAGANAGGDGFGGGLYAQQGGHVTVAGNFIGSGNQAIGGTGNVIGGDGFGGGLYAQQGGDVTVAGNFIGSGNQAIGGTGNLIGAGLGGGVFIVSGNVIFSPPATVNQKLADAVAGGGGLTVAGPGTLTLSGKDTYSGVTTIQQGVLNVQNPGALGPATTTVVAGAVLDLNATKQIIDGADIGGTLADALDGTGSGQFGKLAISGNATIAGTLDISLVDGFQLAVGDRFDIMSFNAVLGDFTAFAFEDHSCIWTQSSIGGTADCGSGLGFSLNEMAGSSPDPFYQLDVTSTSSVPVPEPGTLTLLGSAIGILLLLRRRRATFSRERPQSARGVNCSADREYPLSTRLRLFP